jgi:hypothetical protein
MLVRCVWVQVGLGIMSDTRQTADSMAHPLFVLSLLACVLPEHM